MKDIKNYILFGVVSLVLVLAICVQIRTVSNSATAVSQSFTEDGLRDEVLKQKEMYDNMLASVDRAQTELESIRTEATSNDESAISVEEKLKYANALAGYTSLTGQGVIVRLDDNKTVTSDTLGIEYYLVHDGDLLQVINELKNAGAEAISVNEERIVNTSSIICVGNVVSINGEKVGAPYIINAIGNPEKLYGALTRPEGYIKLLNRTGVTAELKKSTNITIPKYTGAYNFEYIK